MGTTINDRFVTLIKAVNMNISSFAKSIDKAYTSVEAICKGKTRPSYDLLESVFVHYPQLSRDWLVMGDGEMFRVEPSHTGPSDSYLKEHLHTLEENFNRLASQLEKKDQQLEAADRRAEGLQRTIDALISRPSAPTANFLNGVAVGRSIVRMHPATQLLQEQAVA